MLLGVAGPGGQFPRPVPVPHIIQGVLGIRFAPLLLYLRHAGFSTIFARFCRFSPIFAPFSAFLAPWPHLPGGTRSRNTETGGREPQTPLGGGEKNHAPGGEPGRAQHSAGAGDGLAPPSQGRSAAQRQRGGTRRGRAAGGGGDRRESVETGSRLAQRRGRPAAGRPPGGAGTTHRPPTTPQTRRTGDERLAKRAALAPPAAYRRCFVRQSRRSKRVGVVAPPRARNQPGQTPRRHPATGGARPHPAPRCRFARAQQTTHWPPGPRWQMAGRCRDRISICSAILYPLWLIHSRLSEGAEMRPCAAAFPCDRANIRQGHPPGVRRAGALIPWDGLSSTGGLSSAPRSTASAPGGHVPNIAC